MKNEQLFWFAPNGDFHDLMAEGIVPLWGQRGAHMPPVRIVRQPIAGLPGATLQQVEADVRPFSLPCIITSSSEDTFRATMDGWVRTFDPTKGPGTLRFARTDGTGRDLTCICVSGLDFTEDDGNRGPGWVRTVLEFEADGPYWQSTIQTQSWAAEDEGEPWFDPPAKYLLPITLAASAVLGETSLVINSNRDVFPLWEIRGPADTVTLENSTTGRSLTWVGTLVAGDLLTIDAAAGTVTFLASGGTVGEDETNAFPGLTSWDFWPLIDGTNELDLAISGTDSNSSVRAYWREGRLGV